MVLKKNESKSFSFVVNMWSVYFLVIIMAVAGVRARTVSSSNVEVIGNSLVDNDSKPNAESSTSSLLSDIRFLYRIYEECSDTDLSTCLKMKLVIAMDRADKSMSSLKIIDGVSFERDPNVPIESVKPVAEKELEATLPRSLHDRETTLDKLIIEKMYQFFNSYNLQFKLLAMDDIKRSLSSESEGDTSRRRKGMNSLMFLSMLLGGTMLPLKFGALALLAGKALIISKLALALAAIIGLKKLVSSGGGGHDTSYQVVTVPSHGHGGGHYKRSMIDGSDLAYKAYAPQSNT